MSMSSEITNVESSVVDSQGNEQRHRRNLT